MKSTLSIDNHKVISWNKLYSQRHWIVRKNMADEIHQLIKFEAIGQEIPHFDKPVKLKMIAGKKSRPVDASNICLKLYEDGLVNAGILDSDDYKHVLEVILVSVKANIDYIEIEISDEV
ncbi:MAG: hypothetical protein KKH92_00060 [Firmicutes bacterium]|nr:hypothetical protein [Bacillota bacterium]